MEQQQTQAYASELHPDSDQAVSERETAVQQPAVRNESGAVSVPKAQSSAAPPAALTQEPGSTTIVQQDRAATWEQLRRRAHRRQQASRVMNGLFWIFDV